MGVPTLGGGVPPLDRGTYLGWGVLTLDGVPTLDRGYLPLYSQLEGRYPPPIDWSIDPPPCQLEGRYPSSPYGLTHKVKILLSPILWMRAVKIHHTSCRKVGPYAKVKLMMINENSGHNVGLWVTPGIVIIDGVGLVAK